MQDILPSKTMPSEVAGYGEPGANKWSRKSAVYKTSLGDVRSRVLDCPRTDATCLKRSLEHVISIPDLAAESVQRSKKHTHVCTEQNHQRIAVMLPKLRPKHNLCSREQQHTSFAVMLHPDKHNEPESLPDLLSESLQFTQYWYAYACITSDICKAGRMHNSGLQLTSDGFQVVPNIQSLTKKGCKSILSQKRLHQNTPDTRQKNAWTFY